LAERLEMLRQQPGFPMGISRLPVRQVCSQKLGWARQPLGRRLLMRVRTEIVSKSFRVNLVRAREHRPRDSVTPEDGARAISNVSLPIRLCRVPAGPEKNRVATPRAIFGAGSGGERPVLAAASPRDLAEHAGSGARLPSSALCRFRSPPSRRPWRLAISTAFCGPEISSPASFGPLPGKENQRGRPAEMIGARSRLAG